MFDRLGAAHESSVGYRGTRNLIFEIGNLFIASAHEPRSGQLAQPRRWQPASRPKRRRLETPNRNSKTGGIMKVAFATQDLQARRRPFRLGQEYRGLRGHARRPCRSSQTFEFAGDLQEDGNEDKLAPKLDAIKDCAILYVAAIGGSGAARVVAQNIHPMKVNQPEEILDILDKLQDVLKGTPPPWLRKALGKGQERKFEFEEEV